MAPPTTMQPTKMNGSSIAVAICCEKPFACFSAGEISGSGLSLDSEGIVSEPGEWLRIQPRGEGYKQGRAEGDSLGVGHEWHGGVPGLFEPGVNDDAKIVVERGDDVERGKYRKHRMMGFDEREKDEVLAHKASGRRNSGERKHEDEEKNGCCQIALVEAVKIVEFVADDAALAKNDDDGEGADGHECVGDQVVDDPREAGFIAGHEAKKNVADVRDGGVGEQALDVGLRERRKVAPGERSDGDSRYQALPDGLRATEDPDEQANEQREAGSLGGHADVSSNGRGRAFVDVWRPLVEWDGGNFEEEACGDSDKRED